MDEEKCMKLFSEQAVPDKVKKHCQKVAYIAENLAVKLNNKCCNLNIDLIRSAALLHDIARTEKNHETVGAKLLDKLGYPEIALIVASHMKLEEYDTNHITENTVVYLADKLVKNDKMVTLEERFSAKMECTYKNEVQERYKQAVKVRDMVLNALK